MLSSFGELWSFGFNQYGQLGLGHCESNFTTTEPIQICKFTSDTSHFITDICASSKGSSFAVDNTGSLYRWGFNQVDETHYPIKDRFKTIINYETNQLLYRTHTPAPVGKIITGQVKQIEVSDHHFFTLTKDGVLYGWGRIAMLGCGTLKDISER